MSEDLVKIAVLEQKLIDFSGIVGKLDNAIEKLSEVNTNITKMLAVHNERIEQCNKTDNLIVKMIDDLKDENEKEHKEVKQKINTIETKIEELAKTKWTVMGIGTILVLLISFGPQLISYFNRIPPHSPSQHLVK
jgi:seryl-tRNA synthetase